MMMETQEKFQDLYQRASQRFQAAEDWVTYFREVLGVDGMIRKAFSNPDELSEFERSQEYEEIQQMLVKLRERNTPVNEEEDPTRVITVRLPHSMHETLRNEAHEHRTSMNKLCISKLLQVIDGEMVPKNRSKPEKKRNVEVAAGNGVPVVQSE